MENKIDKPEATPVVETGEQIIDKKIDPVSDIKELNPKDDASKSIVMPSVAYDKLIDVLDNLNKLTKEQFKERYNKKESLSIGTNIDGMRVGLMDDMLNKDTTDMYNEINYSDKTLNIRPLPLNSGGKKLRGTTAVTAAFSSMTGVGEIIQAPLWHSGFWVTLRPVKDSEIVNLEIALANNHIELGRDTNALIYSNYSVIYNRIVTDFIVDHIQNTTLNIPDDRDIRDFIKVQDLLPLVNSILYGMHPTGYDFIRSCSNSAIFENDKPKCDFTLTARIDFRKLLWVNRKNLSQDMLRQMSKREPDILSIDDVKDYQMRLETNSSRDITINTANGTVVNMTLSTPSLGDYITNGELWIQNVIKNSEKLFTESMDDVVKNRLINEMLITVVLGIYNVFVSKIEANGDIVDERADIDTALEIMSSDDNMLKALLDNVKKFINDSTIAIVGIPTYTCPNCNKEQDSSENVNFKEIIPINVVESFFDLCTLRTVKLKNRNIS